ncbi:CDP-glycerol glycerophosphotransferase family protein [Budviciaceae bacterium CWB-B4]|uniref:CDP-glycerol glycerophosphotransferase family protein n=1 Tax=Limnobaculum xujianqingii TaxID=2738837 RepID=A0A9D7FVS3_9GAMM|nr:CDP-glycerol glycerophosphotransferase family protein [Limnobaculum xujianqingii]MBK5074431.1 CDP-glycerol glycerophosphotransferase family protein [Limnobaculum xujianqingii]MBK5177903.1 CDP-glycerol glycerophosphotransferase family protein [Limnobaculum xujianqingii]
MRKISFLLRNIIALIVAIPFYFFKNGTYAFYSPHGKKGNVKYLYDHYLLKKESAFFVEKDDISSDLKFISLAIKLARARVLFLTHGVGGLPISWLLVCRVQLWHGYPLKKILLDCNDDCNPFKLGFLNKIYSYFYKKRIDVSYNYLITSDSLLGNILAKSFDFEEKKVKYFGSPSIEIAGSEVISKEIKGKGFKVLYLPTWRDGELVIKDIIEELFEKIDKNFLNKNNIEIHIKLHPNDLACIEHINSVGKIKVIPYDIGDMISFIRQYDCLITDYSSCCFEFSPMKKPIIFYTPDIDTYLSKRGMYLELKALIGEERVILTIDELKVMLVKAKNEPQKYTYDFERYVGKSDGCMDKIYHEFK